MFSRSQLATINFCSRLTSAISLYAQVQFHAKYPLIGSQSDREFTFSYAILHNILATNSILYKMKKVASPSCPFCPSDSQNVHHLFISYPQASSFWDKFQSWFSTVSNANLLLSEPEVLFGVTRPSTHRLTLNHLIMLGKYFLYINALSNTKFAFSDFISLVQDKMEIEKYIAATLNGERDFQQKWKFFLAS